MIFLGDSIYSSHFLEQLQYFKGILLIPSTGITVIQPTSDKCMDQLFSIALGQNAPDFDDITQRKLILKPVCSVYEKTNLGQK